MSRMNEPLPVLRVCSCLTSRPAAVEEVAIRLKEAFGDIILTSEPFPFDCTTYYQPEMGEGIRRYWFCFADLFGAEEIVGFRHKTGEIEEFFMSNGQRTVNLDPGYLDHGKLVLASLKGAADKIYMGGGVWAHTCLRFRFSEFVAPDHSFADFKEGIFNQFFLDLRGLYKKMLKSRVKEVDLGR